MTMYRCMGGQSTNDSLIAMLKRTLYPNWRVKMPLPSSVSSANDLSFCYTGTGTISKLTFAALLSLDQYNYICTDFTPNYVVIEFITAQMARIRLLKDIPTIDDSGNIIFGDRYVYTLSEININTLKQHGDITIPVYSGASSYQLSAFLWVTTNINSVLFSNVDIVSPNGRYHIYKNIELTDFNIVIPTN